MIIDNTYFKGEIYIPHANPSITEDVLGVEEDIVDFINQYSSDCLDKSLGYKLSKEFKSQLDSNEPNGLKVGADQKWDDLLNGKEYTDSSGVTRYWRGIRWKTVEGDDKPYNRSLLAYYVYYYYEKDANSTRAGVGDVQENAKNAKQVSRIPKVVNAWRYFIEQTQGYANSPAYINKPYGYGIDWFGDNGGLVSMYRFILDMNQVDPTIYEDFDPKRWINLNQLNI